jgi:prepilin-type processing-associated H-X9-DG protein
MYSQDYDEQIIPYWVMVNGKAIRWQALIMPYIKNSQIFTCPSASDLKLPADPNSEFSGYGISISFGSFQTLPGLLKPAETIMLADSISYYCTGGCRNGSYIVKAASADPVTGMVDARWPGQVWANASSGAVYEPTDKRAAHYRHSEMANFAFADGHVKAMKKSAAEQTATSEDGAPLSGNNAVVATNSFLYWNNAGK